MKFKTLSILVSLLIMAGCAIQHQVAVDGINSPGAPKGGHYVLVSGIPHTGPEDLMFQTAAGFLKRALARQGYTEASSMEHAAQVIMLSYEVSGPQIITDVHTVQQDPGYYKYGYYPRTYTTHHKVYVRRLMVKAYDALSFRSPKRLQYWRTSAVSIGETGDLRRFLPVLVAAVEPYLGANTQNEIKVLVAEDDERLDPNPFIPQ